MRCTSRVNCVLITSYWSGRGYWYLRNSFYDFKKLYWVWHFLKIEAFLYDLAPFETIFMFDNSIANLQVYVKEMPSMSESVRDWSMILSRSELSKSNAISFIRMYSEGDESFFQQGYHGYSDSKKDIYRVYILNRFYFKKQTSFLF